MTISKEDLHEIVSDYNLKLISSPINTDTVSYYAVVSKENKLRYAIKVMRGSGDDNSVIPTLLYYTSNTLKAYCGIYPDALTMSSLINKTINECTEWEFDKKYEVVLGNPGLLVKSDIKVLTDGTIRTFLKSVIDE